MSLVPTKASSALHIVYKFSRIEEYSAIKTPSNGSVVCQHQGDYVRTTSYSPDKPPTTVGHQLPKLGAAIDIDLTQFGSLESTRAQAPEPLPNGSTLTYRFQDGVGQLDPAERGGSTQAVSWVNRVQQ